MSVPKLRFPEFKDAGEWEEKPLSKIANRITQRNSSNSVTRVLSNSAVDGVVDQRDYFEKDIANQDNLQNYFVVDKGDYVYNPRVSTTAPVGPISRNKIGKGLMSPLYTVFRFKDKSNDFYEQLFRTNLWHKYLKIVSNIGARHDRMAISNDDFMEMPLPFPLPKEQQKIADCLSSLDDLIAAHNQKLAALKTRKKSLLQQLFPAEGETVPELRFPEFRDKEEWEEIKAGLLFTNRIEKGNTGLPIYSVTMNDGMVKRSSFDRDFYDIADPKGNKKANAGDIVYNMMRMWQGASGAAPIDCMVSPAYVILAPKVELITDFFAYLFKLPKYIQLLTAHSQGLTEDRLRLYFKDFARIPLIVPPPFEQLKIAECLSSLDNLIATQIQKIEVLKQLNKGLMQQLFPQTEEAGA